MKRKMYGKILSVMILGGLLAACSENAAPSETAATQAADTAASESSATEETVSETASQMTTTSETTVSETTVSETAATETTTEETTTAAPTETTVTETEATEFVPYTPKQYDLEYPDIVPLYQREGYINNTGYLFSYLVFDDELIPDYRDYESREMFDIDDPEILYLTENAHFIRYNLFWGGKTVWLDSIPQTKNDTYSLNASDNFCYYMCPTYVNYPSFIDYAASVFTDEYISMLQNKDVTSFNSYHVPQIADVDGQIYCSSEERGIDPVRVSTKYSLVEKNDTKATIVRITTCDITDSGNLKDFYCYIDLVKTPDGWRFDYFPMVDEYYNDIDENGEWLFPEYHQ